jgi:hypothetical protein
MLTASRAESTHDRFTKEDFFDLEGRWLRLACSYKLTEQLETGWQSGTRTAIGRSCRYFCWRRALAPIADFVRMNLQANCSGGGTCSGPLFRP